MIKPVTDYSVVPVDPTNASVSSADGSTRVIDTSLSWDIWDKLEIGTNLRWDESPALLTLKYQFLGAPSSEAKKGNISLAFWCGAGSTSNGSQSNTLLRSQGFGDNVAGVASQSTLVASEDLLLLGGYRPTNNFLIYLGPGYTQGRVSGNVSQDYNGLKPNTSFTSAGRISSANLGVVYKPGENDNFFLIIEESYATVSWQTGSKKETSSFHTGFGLGWGL